MSQALAQHFSHDALLPRAPGGMGRGAVLALLAHGALVFALTSTVQWRASPPEVLSAELWSAVPQAAAPAPVAAPPPPVVALPPPPPPVAPAAQPPAAAKPTPPPPPVAPDADIATEQARKQAAQRKALEAEKAEAEKAKAKARLDSERKAQEAERLKAKAEADAKLKKETEAKKAEENKRKEAKAKEEKAKLEEAQRKAAAEAKAEDELLAKQREENLRRMMGQAGTVPPGATGTGGSGTAAQSSAPSASYVGRLIALIKPNIVFTGQVDGNPSAEVEVRSGAGGTILSRRLLKSSGNKDWDEAVLRAIDRTAALPRDADGRVPPALILVFRPGG